MSEPTTGAGLRERLVEALRTTPSRLLDDPGPQARGLCGEGHSYHMACTLCRGEADTLADAILSIVAEHVDARVLAHAVEAGEEIATLATELRGERTLHQTTIDERDRLAAEVEALRTALARVRGLHQRYRDVYAVGDDYSCAHCGQLTGDRVSWPCPTMQALDGDGEAS